MSAGNVHVRDATDLDDKRSVTTESVHTGVHVFAGLTPEWRIHLSLFLFFWVTRVVMTGSNAGMQGEDESVAACVGASAAACLAAVCGRWVVSEAMGGVGGCPPAEPSGGGGACGCTCVKRGAVQTRQGRQVGSSACVSDGVSYPATRVLGLQGVCT